MPPPVLCLSHLRWDFVYQRPNHLMARAARDRTVLFVEEPSIGGGPELQCRSIDGLTVVRPVLPDGLTSVDRSAVLGALMRQLLDGAGAVRPWLWYYTPMAVPWTAEIEAGAVVYDCMDELTAFRGAPRRLAELEAALFERADIVFTGGHALYAAKRTRHERIRPMPSAVDVAHFNRARQAGPEPLDQAAIGRPRIGFFGVIDERIDRELILAVARRRPSWQIVLVGPVAKLAPDEIPIGPNIHLLGRKPYAELPDYLRGWDVAIMPFAHNAATRFISPTKTPEYLAGGRAVVSTAIRDVVEPYGRLGLVRIADSPDDFVAAIEAALTDDRGRVWSGADGLLAEMSWDATWARMEGLVRTAVQDRDRQAASLPEPPAPAVAVSLAAPLRPASGRRLAARRVSRPMEEVG